jgi:hypothetical protein
VRDDIPLEFVDAEGLKARRKGVTTHHECWKAFGGDVRTDPGQHYPMERMLAAARRLVIPDLPFPDKPLEDPMTTPACYSGQRPQDKEGGVWGDPGDGRLRRVADTAVLGVLQSKKVLPTDVTACDPSTLVGIVDFYNYDPPGVD